MAGRLLSAQAAECAHLYARHHAIRRGGARQHLFYVHHHQNELAPTEDQSILFFQAVAPPDRIPGVQRSVYT